MSDTSLRHEPERLQREVLEKLYENTVLSTFEMFRCFPVFTPRLNLARFLVHYELFKKIVNLPGCIIDIGVYRGASTFTWAKLCEIYCATDVLKKVYGFDTFSGFVEIREEDGKENEAQSVHSGGYHGGQTVEMDLQLAQAAMNHDKHISHIDRIELIKGDVAETVPNFLAEKGNGLKVSLLNLDADLYEPTKVALDHFVPRMVRGGIIILDEYAVETFGGESLAVDEYFRENFSSNPKVKKFTWHSNPSAYIEVDW
ncbi:MAG: macrocin O-methyltransferase [Desulfovibrionales bacterium]|nr:macrocin O-methyltransferase [Desulfovibrionales bacterium]